MLADMQNLLHSKGAVRGIVSFKRNETGSSHAFEICIIIEEISANFKQKNSPISLVERKMKNHCHGISEFKNNKRDLMMSYMVLLQVTSSFLNLLYLGENSGVGVRSDQQQDKRKKMQHGLYRSTIAKDPQPMKTCLPH